MTTDHLVFFTSAADMSCLDDNSIDLVVTSPPYPMIEMWDTMFVGLDSEIGICLEHGDGDGAFERMHASLDSVWEQLPRVLAEGGLVCINIGEAVRTMAGQFRLYSNHSRITACLLELGFHNLPNIIWRKASNAPNKFMGSGMLPVGAYVTLEHEYILVFRNGSRRRFERSEDKSRRRESAFFWEERNRWFSDIWFDLTGAGQELSERSVRKRSAAFPLELAYRLVNMFSIKEDTVLDPFLGTGTTMLAAALTGRHSRGFELDAGFTSLIDRAMNGLPEQSERLVRERVEAHHRFVGERTRMGRRPKHTVESLSLPCVSKQETDIRLEQVDRVIGGPREGYSASYRLFPSDR